MLIALLSIGRGVDLVDEEVQPSLDGRNDHSRAFNFLRTNFIANAFSKKGFLLYSEPCSFFITMRRGRRRMAVTLNYSAPCTPCNRMAGVE